MNTRNAPRLFAFFSAAVLTVAMLASVDTLATRQRTASQLAQSTLAHKA